MQVSHELGVIDEGLAGRIFQNLGPAFDRCEAEGEARLGVLSGALSLLVRVGQDGTPRHAYLKESTVGDRDVERCMLREVMGARFPKPDGGEAEVTYRTRLRAEPARPANEWPAEKIQHLADRARACLGEHGGRYQVTLYIGEGDDRQGRVLSVGVAPPDKDGDRNVDCIVQSLKGAKAPSPGSWPAKATLSL